MWSEIRVRLANYIPVDIINTDLIGLRFTNNTFSNEITWVVGSYIYAVWNSLYVKGDSFLNRDSFFGFLKFKFKSDQFGARVQLKNIPGLFD